ncbi:S-adenosyl-L-methionine-dependent methyltransferase [Trichoderma velutinum]
MASSKPAHLDPSELGTKEYWDKLYTTELTNHAANPSDTGTNWFDDSDAEGRIVAFLDSLTEDDQDILERPLSKEGAALLDLGCGNGELLFSLRDDGWEGEMLGVDYSAQSVALAQRIGETRDAEEEAEAEEGEKEEAAKTPSVRFLEWDLLAGPISPDDAASPLSFAPSQETLFDIILDKGTFDAISLSAANADVNPCEAYRKRLLQLLNPNGGVFLVTSCNWTEPELRSWFEEDEDGQLRVVGRVEYPTFTFGGVKGQTITTLCFRRGVVRE